MRCPQCDSNRPYRDGLRYLADGTIVQRWLCRNCGFRFTDPSKNSKSQTFHSYENGAHQKAAKLLVEAEKAYSEKREAGATSEYNPNSEIVNFAFWLRKQGYSDATIESRVKRLKRLTLLGADLHDPESVKEVISRQHGWSEGYKETVVEAYSSYLSMKGGKWNPPRYKRVPRLPHIPLEREIDQLIAFFPPKMACLLQLLKETGCRIGEAVRLTWRDIDLEAGTVRITPEKRSDREFFA